MKVQVLHTTRLTYDYPVRAIVQSLRLYPQTNAGQKVLSWDVAIEGANFGTAFRDGAGDVIRTATLAGPLTSCDISVSGEVETTDLAGVLRGHREIMPPSLYLTDTDLTERTGPIEKLALASDETAPLALAHDLSRLVQREVEYRPGVTETYTAAADVLKLGEGVCQDMAHLLIALARQRGLPARYVTGYLAARAGETPHDASHAWCEIHIDQLGWVGFDPANSCCPDDRHIRLGSGRDASAAAPIRGSFIGTQTHHLALEVAVSQVAQ